MSIYNSLQEAAEKEVAAKEAEEKATVKGKVVTYAVMLPIWLLTQAFLAQGNLHV
jgi:hypothetical protein